MRENTMWEDRMAVWTEARIWVWSALGSRWSAEGGLTTVWSLNPRPVYGLHHSNDDLSNHALQKPQISFTGLLQNNKAFSLNSTDQLLSVICIEFSGRFYWKNLFVNNRYGQQRAILEFLSKGIHMNKPEFWVKKENSNYGMEEGLG